MPNFSDSMLRAIWEKAKIIPGQDPDVQRLDDLDNHIRWNEYGRETKEGWEVDHITPVSRGGSDDISNLRPLQWQANRRKADN